MKESWLPAVRASMRERFVIKVRVPAEAMTLPGHLRPRLADGWAIASGRPQSS